MSRPARALRVALLCVLAQALRGDTCAPPTIATTTPTAVPAPAAPVPDADADLVPDYCDNCRDAVNRSQQNTDSDNATEDTCSTTSQHCVARPGTPCTEDADCARPAIGNTCDCDFNDDGVCNIDDFNVFLVDHAAGVDQGNEATPNGTDMNGDGLVDTLDFDRFEALFATGKPGASAAKLPAVGLPGGAGCFEHRWPSEPWSADYVGTSLALGCSASCQAVYDSELPQFVKGAVCPGGAAGTFAAGFDSVRNPTDWVVRNVLFGLGGCPNAAFSSGLASDPRACDKHDICGGRCGYKGADCNRQFHRDLFETCHRLDGGEAQLCEATCIGFAEAFGSYISGSPLVPVGPSPNAWADEDDENPDCACCPPVCEAHADCPGVASCFEGYCLDPHDAVIREGPASCVSSDDCGTGRSCLPDPSGQPHCWRNNAECASNADCDPGFACRESRTSQSYCFVTDLPPARPAGTPPPVCGDGLCQPGETCHAEACPEDCGDLSAPLLAGIGRCPLGERCLGDLDCADGACSSRGVCEKLSAGAICDSPSDCAGDSCDVLFHQCKPGCFQDADCGTGSCFFLGCREPAANFQACDSNPDCQSEVCNFGLCVPFTIPNGFGPCTTNQACQSGVCNAPICIEPGSVDPGGLCTTSPACSSGSCVAGFCSGSCGDDFCTVVPNGENCFNESCQADCGKCPNGTPLCNNDNDCASDFCRLGFCFASGTVNPGSVCVFDKECKRRATGAPGIFLPGDCVAGLCSGTCGDSFCTLVPNGETCFNESCQTDCGKCGALTPGCDNGNDCQSGTCFFGFCGVP